VRFAPIVCFLLSLALAGSCQEPESAKAKPNPETSNLASAALAAKIPAVNFNVDGKKLPAIELSDVTVVLSLKALPPIEEWKMLIVRNMDEREFRAVRPALLTGESTMKIVKQVDQSYEFRVMQGEGAAEIIRHSLPNIKVLEIQTLSYTPPGRGRGKRAIKITRKGETRSLNSAELETIQRTREPGSEKNRDTWLLLDVLGVKSLAKEQSIILKKSAGRELVLTSKDLADSKMMHMIKRNRRGQFQYRGWTLGDAPAKTSELRGIKEIELR
jgi:hypothetical protein